MAYQKPGIEVSQVVKSNTPILSTPELPIAVVGIAYNWLKPSVDNDTSVLTASPYSGGELTLDISSLKNADDTVVTDSIVVDLLSASTGALTHLTPGTHFSFNPSTNVITISGSIGSGTYTPVVGFLSTVSGLYNTVTDIESVSDIKNVLKLTDTSAPSLNPLGFGAQLALTNAGGAALKVINIAADVDAEHTAAQELLELTDVYSIAVLSHDASSAVSYKTHVETQSGPTKKKERIAFINHLQDWTAAKSAMATAIQAQSVAIGSRRVVNVFSDAAYVLETRHINTLRSSFLNAVWGNEVNRPALTTVDYTFGGTTYKKGTPITDSFLASLISNSLVGADGTIPALVPVPGYFYCAALAGAVAAKSPQQPLTNVAVTGFDRAYKTTDYFTEDQLNTMASGGTWIMVQESPAAAVVTRHQVSTDNTSITKRELSVTNAVDYVAKTMRNSLKPYIGRFVIDDNFISLVFTVLTGIALFMRRSGILRDVKINSVVQDNINPDTVLVEVELIPLYPANYIKITLII